MPQRYRYFLNYEFFLEKR